MRKMIVIDVYAALILIGGIVGFLVANSIPSLLISAIFAIILFGCGVLVWRGNSLAYDIATAIVFCLLLFFGYRFFTTFKIAPGGVMGVISCFVLAYLVLNRNKN